MCIYTWDDSMCSGDRDQISTDQMNDWKDVDRVLLAVQDL